MLPRGFIFANGALLRVQGGGSWLSSGSWNNEDVQYVYRNNWNCKRSNKRSIDPNQEFRYSEEDVPKIAKQVFHGTETCTFSVKNANSESNVENSMLHTCLKLLKVSVPYFR